ncbi:unnamed protein product [Hydatigera taeniaeformis]|uniref:Uncharacterized protein n=1 Tax=Hydatigena taeniaeformis TaxID=6205 RepID=A0A3P7EXH7_HYDTA|nr:unnamed protein product [Hydatigera taeniaeformis]
MRQESRSFGLVNPLGDLGCNDAAQQLNIEKAITPADLGDGGRKYLFEVDLSTATDLSPCSNKTLDESETTPIEMLPVAPLPSPPIITFTSCDEEAEQKKYCEFGKVPADWTSSCPSSTLGVFQLDNGEYILSMLIYKYGEDQRLWRQWLKRVEKTMLGLEKSCKCKITLYNKPFRFRGVMTHMIRIRGLSKRSVIRCKNALPSYIQDRLITAHAYY